MLLRVRMKQTLSEELRQRLTKNITLAKALSDKLFMIKLLVKYVANTILGFDRSGLCAKRLTPSLFCLDLAQFM